MFTKKYILSVLFIGFIASLSVVRADDISDMKTVLTDTVAKLIQKYETRIAELQTENDALRKEIVSLRGTGGTVSAPAIITPPTIPSSSTITTVTTSKSDVYDTVIKQVNGKLGTILSENNLPGYTSIGLFEFIEPNAFFLSLDDGNNPPGVTAFKTKVLYTFDNNLNLTKIGLFELDYAVQKYRTVFGSNPYVSSVRTRIKNPNYKGKLLDGVVSTSGSTANTNTTTSSVSSGNVATTEVTLAQIKTAYDKTKLLDALKLSDSYIIKNPNDLEVLRIRYRSYYIIGKYENSLAEIKKMETLQGTAFERTVACDAAVIGKIAKKTDVSTYYSALCKKK
ncbi:MAG: hypothetical protein PHN60_04695 [Candidatus Gracilibacteria bacterium]|nr:hypothetical protein [Candidatus Gracilibacteria bacterium]